MRRAPQSEGVREDRRSGDATGQEHGPELQEPPHDHTAILHDGYKMKWHQLGPGQVQLRLPVMSHALGARFKTHMNLISQGRYLYRGKL